jgi:hypothetical protein
MSSLNIEQTSNFTIPRRRRRRPVFLINPVAVAIVIIIVLGVIALIGYLASLNPSSHPHHSHSHPHHSHPHHSHPHSSSSYSSSLPSFSSEPACSLCPPCPPCYSYQCSIAYSCGPIIPSTSSSLPISSSGVCSSNAIVPVVSLGPAIGRSQNANCNGIPGGTKKSQFYCAMNK